MVGDLDKVWLDHHHNAIGLPIRPVEVKLSKERGKNAERKWVKVHLTRGKQDKIRKGDLVGFLVKEATIPADEIGTIMVFDTYSIADIPLEFLSGLENPEKPLKIKGKSVKVRKYQQHEQEKKAQAIKKLKQDRRGPV